MKNKSLFWGLFLLGAGVFILGAQVGIFASFSVWTLLLLVFMAAIFITSLPQRNFFGMTIPIAVAYLALDDILELPHVSTWGLIVAAVLVAAGLSAIFRQKKYEEYCFGGNNNIGSCGNGQKFTSSDNNDENHPQVSVTFGSLSKYYHSSALENGMFESNFGKMDIYFDGAELSPAGATIKLECNFGQLCLYIPRHWKVRDKTTATMGNARNYCEPAGEEVNCLTVVGGVNFGDINIRYL